MSDSKIPIALILKEYTKQSKARQSKVKQGKAH